MNIAKLMKQAQQMQAGLAAKQEELAKQTVESSVGGGKVTVTVSPAASTALHSAAPPDAGQKYMPLPCHAQCRTPTTSVEPPRPLANTSDWAAPEVKIVVGCMVTDRVVLL